MQKITGLYQADIGYLMFGIMLLVQIHMNYTPQSKATKLMI